MAAPRMARRNAITIARVCEGSAGDESYAYLQALRELFAIEVAGAPGLDDELPATAEITSLEARRRRRSR